MSRSDSKHCVPRRGRTPYELVNLIPNISGTPSVRPTNDRPESENLQQLSLYSISFAKKWMHAGEKAGRSDLPQVRRFWRAPPPPHLCLHLPPLITERRRATDPRFNGLIIIETITPPINYCEVKRNRCKGVLINKCVLFSCPLNGLLLFNNVINNDLFDS